MKLTGAVTFDGTNEDGVRALAGEDFSHGGDGTPQVRNRDGDQVPLRPGWVVSAWEGYDGVLISSPGGWEITRALAEGQEAA